MERSADRDTLQHTVRTSTNHNLITLSYLIIKLYTLVNSVERACCRKIILMFAAACSTPVTLKISSLLGEHSSFHTIQYHT